MSRVGENIMQDMIEYGLYTVNVAEKIEAVKKAAAKKNESVSVVGAVNNYDHVYKLIDFVADSTDEIVAGYKKLMEAAGAEKAVVCVPEEKTEFAKKLQDAAAKENIEMAVETGIVDVRKHQRDLIVHFETIRAIGAGAQESAPIAVAKITAADCEEIVPMGRVSFGTKLADFIDVDRESVKAVKIAGKLYTADVLDQTVEKDMKLGDGVIRLYDNSCCIVDTVKKAVAVERKESCGKCSFCREGLYQFAMRHEEIAGKKGELRALEIMKKIGKAMKGNTLCSIGQFAGDEVVDAVELFYDEYEAHIKKGKCPAEICKAFTTMYVDPRKCTGCTKCLSVCKEDCIEGFEGYIHMIEDMYCTKCGACIEVCPDNAIFKTSGRVPNLPDRLTKVGRFKRY